MGMCFGPARFTFVLVTAAWLVGLSCGAAQADIRPAGTVPSTDSPGAPVLQNPGFECTVGYVTQAGIQRRVPLGWTGVLISGTPQLDSVRIRWGGGCNGTAWVERLEGEDSLVFVAQDLETPPAPGKPFDAAVYQQVAVTPGTTYSLSGWMVSLCGGSATPSNCPADYWMEKLLGIDPTGGVDPLGPNVIWVSDRRNFTESRWANLRLAATVQSDHLTVFGRIRSPFQWHGNHAFVDAFSLVRAPTAYFVNSPARISSTEARVQWNGAQSPDVQAIPGGKYKLFFDVQYRIGAAGRLDRLALRSDGGERDIHRGRLHGGAGIRVSRAEPRRTDQRRRRVPEPPLSRRLERAGVDRPGFAVGLRAPRLSALDAAIALNHALCDVRSPACPVVQSAHAHPHPPSRSCQPNRRGRGGRAASVGGQGTDRGTRPINCGIMTWSVA